MDGPQTPATAGTGQINFGQFLNTPQVKAALDARDYRALADPDTISNYMQYDHDVPQASSLTDQQYSFVKAMQATANDRIDQAGDLLFDIDHHQLQQLIEQQHEYDVEHNAVNDGVVGGVFVNNGLYAIEEVAELAQCYNVATWTDAHKMKEIDLVDSADDLDIERKPDEDDDAFIDRLLSELKGEPVDRETAREHRIEELVDITCFLLQCRTRILQALNRYTADGAFGTDDLDDAVMNIAQYELIPLYNGLESSRNDVFRAASAVTAELDDDGIDVAIQEHDLDMLDSLASLEDHPHSDVMRLDQPTDVIAGRLMLDIANNAATSTAIHGAIEQLAANNADSEDIVETGVSGLQAVWSGLASVFRLASMEDTPPDAFIETHADKVEINHKRQDGDIAGRSDYERDAA